MDIELQNKLTDRFKFYKLGETPQHYFFFGFECGNGWFQLLWKLSEDLEKLNCEIDVHQVKEKFGSLRYYYSVYTSYTLFRIPYKFNVLTKWKVQRLYDFIRINIFRYKTKSEKIDELVTKAEDDSYTICEDCGKSGEVRDWGWVRTMCDKCYSEMMERKGFKEK